MPARLNKSTVDARRPADSFGDCSLSQKGANMNDQAKQELLGLNLQLLQAIVTDDWKTYKDMCDPTLTAF